MVHRIRKERKPCRMLAVLWVGLWLGCCSCGILPTRQYRQDNWKSTGWKGRTDSLSRKVQVETGLCREVVLERIRYSPPDTLGIQHRQEILRVRISEDEKTGHRIREEKVCTSEEQVVAARRTMKEKSRFRWLFYAGGLLVVAGIWYLFRVR